MTCIGNEGIVGQVFVDAGHFYVIPVIDLEGFLDGILLTKKGFCCGSG